MKAALIPEEKPKPPYNGSAAPTWMTRKHPDWLVHDIIHKYPDMTHKQVAMITGVPMYTVKSYRSGKRRSTRLKRSRGEIYTDMQGEQLRLFFINKAIKVLELYTRIQAEFDRTGDFNEPAEDEFRAYSHAEQARRVGDTERIQRINAARTQAKLLAERDREGRALAAQSQVLAGGPPLHQEGGNLGQGKPQAPGVLYDRR